MYIVEVHECDGRSINETIRYEYKDRDVAETSYAYEKRKDYDYGDNVRYRFTKLFERN